MRAVLSLVLLATSALLVAATTPAAPVATAAAGPLSLQVRAVGVINPVFTKAAAAAADAATGYLPGKDFIGKFYGVPMNPTRHLQAKLAEDRKYVASILRTPLDLGDPAACEHSDIVKDERELRRIALRINHRRVALRQQQQWIDSATDGLKRIEEEITSTTETARSLAEQLDSLTAQKDDITAHVRRAHVLRELDSQSANLMRLKDVRVAQEVLAQENHNKRVLQNSEHNEVLSKLRVMREEQGLALGALDDPKPYRFAQQGLDSAAEEANQADNEAEQEADNENENEVEADNENEVEQEADAEGEAEAEAEDSE